MSSYFIEFESYEKAVGNYSVKESRVKLFDYDAALDLTMDDIYYKLGTHLYSRHFEYWNVALVF